MTKEFYSNGKLLLSGEYAVLDGAYAWAVPTRFGQSITVTKNDSSQLKWTSVDEKGNIWFEGIYNLGPLIEVSSSEVGVSETLLGVLRQAQILNTSFLVDSLGCEVETKMDFPRNWGLGSSSTLINNIAQWAEVDPYALLSKTFGGSGYDIACARNNSPILYKLEGIAPKVQAIDYNPTFIDNLYFVYLNKKQNSREGIARYREQNFDLDELVANISNISIQFLECKELSVFENLINKHERLLSKILKLKTVKEKLFPDYSGAIKSLGAWGGDFILATGDKSTPEYFKEKGYDISIPYSEMVLS